jgi:hypothetical protein
MASVSQALKFSILRDGHLVFIVVVAFTAVLIVKLSDFVFGIDALLRNILQLAVELEVALGDGPIVVSLLILDLLVLSLHDVDL